MNCWIYKFRHCHIDLKPDFPLGVDSDGSSLTFENMPQFYRDQPSSTIQVSTREAKIAPMQLPALLILEFCPKAVTAVITPPLPRT